MAFVAVSCVQPVKKHTITFRLSAKGIPSASQVSVVGGDKPLSWDKGLALRYDSLGKNYTATITVLTGYRYTEYKYKVDDSFELEGQGNREATLSTDGNTVLTDTLNVR